MYFPKEYIDKIAQSITETGSSYRSSSGIGSSSGSSLSGNSRYGSGTNSLDNTLSKARKKHDTQPLHVYTKSIDKPVDQQFSNKMIRRNATMSHLEDKRITYRPITRNSGFSSSNTF